MEENMIPRMALIMVFQKYVSGEVDESVIRKYTAKEIKYALEKCAFGDHQEAWYRAMQKRLEELMPVKKEEEERKILETERFWNWIIIIVVTAIVGVFGIILVRFGLRFGV